MKLYNLDYIMARVGFCLKRWVFSSKGWFLPQIPYVKRVGFCLILKYLWILIARIK